MLPQKNFKFRGSEIAISCVFYRSFSVNKYAEKAIFHCLFYISSVISKVKCLQKKGQNSDALKKVTSRGQDILICPSDRQMHQNDAKDLSVILI